jgi:NitT/TauT family transport system permease protein
MTALPSPNEVAMRSEVELGSDLERRPESQTFGKRHRRGLLALARLAIIAALLFVWWLVGELGLLNPLTFPTLGETITQLFRVVIDGSIFYHSWFTLQAAALGFIIGMGVGTILGFIIGLSPLLTDLLQPFISVFNTMPRIAIAPIYVLWFGIGVPAGVALVVSVVIFTALLSVISGTQSVDRNYITIVRLYGGSRYDIIRKVVLPATIPWIITAGRLSLANALAGAIISEMFLGQRGLGYLIGSASGSFNMGVVFAAILGSLGMAVIFDRIGTFAEDRLLRWRPTLS